MRRLNVDRMRRHQRGPHSVPWVLGWVRGPYLYASPERSIRLSDEDRAELVRVQRWAGITVDGELGPQSWLLLAGMNSARRRNEEGAR